MRRADFEGDVGAEPVVERLRDEPAVRELNGRPAQTPASPGRTSVLGLLAALRADVDVQVGQLQLRPLANSSCDGRFRAINTGDPAVARVDLNPLSVQRLGSDAADRA